MKEFLVGLWKVLKRVGLAVWVTLVVAGTAFLLVMMFVSITGIGPEWLKMSPSSVDRRSEYADCNVYSIRIDEARSTDERIGWEDALVDCIDTNRQIARGG